jgi:hypothetical protein
VQLATTMCQAAPIEHTTTKQTQTKTEQQTKLSCFAQWDALESSVLEIPCAFL